MISPVTVFQPFEALTAHPRGGWRGTAAEKRRCRLRRGSGCSSRATRPNPVVETVPSRVDKRSEARAHLVGARGNHFQISEDARLHAP